MGEIVLDILKFLFEDALTKFVSPILSMMQIVALSPDTIKKFPFIDTIYPAMQGIGIGILILVTSWQSLKCMLASYGFTAEEPQKIAVKAFVSGFLVFYIKDIMMKFIEIGGNMITSIASSISGGFDGTGLFQILLAVLSSGGLLLVLVLVLIYHCLVLFWKMFLRLAMCAALLLGSPLAVASIVSKETEGFWQGFVKLFVGNIIIQLMQSASVVAIIIMLGSITPELTKATIINPEVFFGMMLLIALISITNKLEDIIRDLSISVGIGRDMQGALSKISSVSYAASNVTRMVASFAGR